MQSGNLYQQYLSLFNERLATRKTAGFTIIEVLIVLAIAGLIMLVVFLAVPNLQRSQRNSQYKNEAASIIASYGSYVTNNAGGIPAASVSSTAGSGAAIVLSGANVKNVTFLTIQAQGGTTRPSIRSSVIRTAAKCSAASGSDTTIAAATREAALLYVTEAKGQTYNGVADTQVQCLEG
jgi:prepilin-type N-terminal cleavage/methylation domain-containing protein